MNLSRARSVVTGDDLALARRRRLGAVPQAVLTVALAACTLGACTAGEPGPSLSGDSGAPTEPGAPTPTEIVVDADDEDTCGLLPPDQLTDVLGEEVQSTPVPSGGWTAGQCSWSGPESAFILSIGTQESIAAFDDPGEPDAETKLAAYRDRQADAAQDVTDLGDAAVGGVTGMAARVGQTFLELEVLSLPDDQRDEVMRLAVANVAG